MDGLGFVLSFLVIMAVLDPALVGRRIAKARDAYERARRLPGGAS